MAAPTPGTWAWSRPRRSSGTTSRPRPGSPCRPWPPSGSLPSDRRPGSAPGGAAGRGRRRIRGLGAEGALAGRAPGRGGRGVGGGKVGGGAAGDDSLLVLDGERERPDPRSRFQPHGVHGPSRLVDLGPPPTLCATPALCDLVFYELHCGTFTPEGTFDAAIGRLGHLRELG